MIKIGFGKDIHKLEKGDYLILGGVQIPSKFKSVSFSDGDVLTHALIDALLGSIGKGDIGDHFKDDDIKNKNRLSIEFLIEVKKMLDSAKAKIINIDSLIVLEEPKLKENKAKIIKNLAKTLSINENSINIKAGTNEGFDAIGKKKAIEATVVCLVEVED